MAIKLKTGDIVTLRNDRVAIQLLNDSLEKNQNVKKRFVVEEYSGDIIAFRRGETGMVLEENRGRVKILYKSREWWGNSSDLFLLE